VAAIPVYLLTGYLGAGKTTTLNHLLKLEREQGRKVALIINEFGKLGVDGKLLDPGDYAKYEINKGSLFCICTQTDFLKALAGIARDICPDRVFIEATGIAEPRDIESLITEHPLQQRFEVKAKLCIADAQNFTKIAPFMKAARSQARWADGIVINKTDMVTAGEVKNLTAVMAGLNPQAKITSAENGRIDSAFVASLVHTRRDASAVEVPPENIIAVSYKTEQAVERQIFINAIKELDDRLLRLKGNIHFQDGPAFVEVVCGNMTEKALCAKLSANTAFCAIVWKTDREELNALFDKCCVTGS